eukprot:8702412-Pyramimonas_sp.AAC.1
MTCFLAVPRWPHLRTADVERVLFCDGDEGERLEGRLGMTMFHQQRSSPIGKALWLVPPMMKGNDDHDGGVGGDDDVDVGQSTQGCF